MDKVARQLLKIFRLTGYSVSLAFALSVLVVTSQAQAEDKDNLHQLSQEEKSKFASTKFESITKTKALPEKVAENLGINGKDNAMADAGADWSAGCTGPQNSPHQRLIFAGKSADRCFVYFERGGIAHFEIVQLYSLGDAGKNSDAKLIWETHISRPIKDIDALKTAISKGDIH